MAATEYSLTVPVDLVKKTKGLAIDTGGSVMKIVYRSKENLEEAERNKEGLQGHLQLVYFPKDRLTEALEYIKGRAKITRNGTEEKPEIFTIGVGSAFLGKTFSDALNIRTSNMVEFESFVKGFIYFASKMSRTDFLEPLDREVVRQAEAAMKGEMAIYATIQQHDPTGDFKGLDSNFSDSQQLTKDETFSPDDPLERCEDIYPCMLAMCGSVTTYIQINADKSFKVLDVCHRGGASLHGLGTLLTGRKNFEEFLELASRGDTRKVDIYSDDLFKKDEAAEESLYTTVNQTPSFLAYNFGKAVGAKKDDFRPEDLAIAWLNHVAVDIVEGLTFNAELHGIRRIFFCGSTCNSHLVRSILTKEMTRRLIFLSLFGPRKVGGRPTRFDFIKPGSHLGALGALIAELETLTEGSKTTQ